MGANVTLSVDTTGLVNKRYQFRLRESGTQDGSPVTHLLEMTLDVGTASGGASQYVDVLGYALFQITAVASNHVDGQAIAGIKYDPNDPALARGRTDRLVPGGTSP